MRKIFLRGFLRSLILTLLKKKSMHGYELIKEIKEKTFFWKPSPGTIYPLLKKLEKEGLIRKKKEKRKFVYFLTKKGEKEVKDLMKIRREIRSEIKKFLRTFSISYTDFFEKRNKIKKHFPLIKAHTFLLMNSLLKREKETVKLIREFDEKLKELISKDE